MMTFFASDLGRIVGRSLALASALIVFGAGGRSASAAEREGIDFFESRIRPVLIDNCYECHNSQEKTEGGLSLDDRAGLLEGGDSGPAIVPGKPDASLLIKAIKHVKGSPRMPRGNAKLSDAVVADFTKWIALGAPDPRDQPPTAGDLKALASWDAVRERRKQWWSFQPIAKPSLPVAAGGERTAHPVDRFIRAALDKERLSPAPPADRLTLIRRVTFALTGLPPSPAEIDQFLNDKSPEAYDHLVDRLLESPRFGERWARHWMDWFRYADSHGSEGDPLIPHAYRYRDYLIRALNADIPYDRLVREHLAGDLLPDPRINGELGINESMLGVGHLRMVQHGYSPTDVLDEQVTFTDNQVDVLSKAFLGLTVSCARCHNHKFDPIGQADFYAFYGIMTSCRPALLTVDVPERQRVHQTELTRLRTEIQRKAAAAWIRSADEVPAKLSHPDAAVRSLLGAAEKAPGHPLNAWTKLSSKEGAGFAGAWAQAERGWRDGKQRGAATEGRWDLTGGAYASWFKHGNGLPVEPSRPGEFHVVAQGEQVFANVYPAGIYTHRLSTKHNGFLTSPRFKVETDDIWVRVAGSKQARVRLVVQNYPRNVGAAYKAYAPEHEEFRWHHWDAKYWRGEWAYIEVATAEDIPVEVQPNDGRSWFGITDVVFGERRGPDEAAAPLVSVAGQANPKSPAELGGVYVAALKGCIEAWTSGTMTNEQATFLSLFVRNRLLPNTLETLPEVAKLVAEYRRLEAEIPVPTRAPGVIEGTIADQPLFVRGNHKKPAEVIPRRFLEAFDTKPYPKDQSGRRELAEDILSPRNSLTSRVIVNRLWHHLYGRGIVATTDNFGRLGDKPTNPELLDYLASRMVDERWSIKAMVRLLVTSRTYQQSDRASQEAVERDPNNAWLSHFPVLRLEAEAIRDAILAVSGRLDERRYGPGERGSDSRRRSVYLTVRRTDLDPFLSSFDAPEPLSTRGRRDTTNVPAQSLMLLNDPWVIESAQRWAESVAQDRTLTEDAQRVRRMFFTALGRFPTADELSRSEQFLAFQDQQRDRDMQEKKRLGGEITARQERIAAVTTPVRDRLQADRKSNPTQVRPPRPIARWEFDNDLSDSIGGLHGTAHGSARLEGGALVLDGQSHVDTVPLRRDLKEKTLEAWVVLDGLDQRGGGVISVETRDGQVFDAIVFGEQDPKKWVAGSDFFRRTQPFQGSEESDAAQSAVQITVVYRANGTILSYRNGVPYGEAYESTGPALFAKAKSHVLFGLRHAPEGGNRMLRGKILRAQLYDHALSADAVAASAAAYAGFVAEASVLAALSETDRKEVERLKREIGELDGKLRDYDAAGASSSDPVRRWRDLGHAILNFKEFIYLR